jgi:hypothetical protein
MNLIKQKAARIRWQKHAIPLTVRFWSKVEICGLDECWLWFGSLPSTGHAYGRFNLKGTSGLAHRVAFYLSRGYINQSLHVLHTCDNPPCCNPTHLWQGTHQQNMKDRNLKLRCAVLRGSQNGHAKLSEAEVIEIWKKFEIGQSQIQIASSFGVSKHAIWRIIHKKNWAHLEA